jgi:hypothetical protein
MNQLAFLTLTALLLAPLAGLHAADATAIQWVGLTANAGGGKGFVQLSSGEVLATRTHCESNEALVVCSRSEDDGRTWRDLSTIVRVPGKQDVGDGHLIQLKSGEVLYSFRQNFTGGGAKEARTYSIRVAASRDGGRSWRPHSVVAESIAASDASRDDIRGLWSSYLLAKRDGDLLCFFDDEATPDREGFHGQQWLMAKTWDPKQQTWGQPVIVSRSGERQLSRDGMASVVELESGRLLAALESAQTDKPHVNLIRFVTSDDGGKTWSWRTNDRSVLFEPGDHRHMAVAPWLAQCPGDTLICVFATDEDRAEPDQPGTPPAQFHMDIKCVLSCDGGKSWTQRAETVFTGSHRCYAPGVAVLQDRSLLLTFVDFATGVAHALRGDLKRE